MEKLLFGLYNWSYYFIPTCFVTLGDENYVIFNLFYHLHSIFFTFGPYAIFVVLDILQTTSQHRVLLLTVDHRSRAVFQRNIESACEVNI